MTAEWIGSLESQSFTLDLGPIRCEVWDSGRGWPWSVGTDRTSVARNNAICDETSTPEKAKAAAESAARDYATAILAALPARTVTEPTAEELSRVADYLCATSDDGLSWKHVAWAAITAGLDPSRLKEGT